MIHSSFCKKFLPITGLILAAGITGYTAEMRIKLGTLAPRGTSYHKSLLAMAEQFRQISGGTIKLVIFPDGTQGSEADMVGLMQTGSLDAGMLSAVGLSEIDKSVTALQNIPMAFRALAEADAVGDSMRPLIEPRLEAKGFIVLFWADSGWVRFFSKQPVTRPDDLKKLKLFCWAGNTDEADLWKSGGFNPVPLETANILPGLQTGLIDAVPMPPFFALAGQVDGQARHMLEINWAPLVGALVMTRSSWEKIPAQHRDAILQTARRTGQEIKTNGRAESDQAVAAMKKRGLQVTPVTPDLETQWRRTAESYYPLIRGKLVPAVLFDQVMQVLKQHREGTKGSRP